MASLAQTLVRFVGAVALGTAATAVDNPRLFADNTQRVVVRTRDARGGGRPAVAAGITITPGKRAFGIRVDDPSQLARTIEPNSRVDVLAVVPDAAKGRTRALLVIQNLRVLAIHAITGAERGVQSSRSAVATLEVTASEGELLARAQSRAPLRLTLRAYGDPPPSDVSVDRR